MARPAATCRVSVVTPLYNTVSYLEECIRSVLAQTHENFEYILVDNCSTDGSGELAASYAARDARIRLIRTPALLPQVENYNFALRQIDAHSTFCKIVQADDWIYPRCLEAMIDVGLRDPRIGIVSSYYLKGTQLCGSGIEAHETHLSGRELARRQLLEDRFFLGSPTAVMYRADIVRQRQPFYATGRYHEDTEAGYEILREHDFAFVHDTLSFLRVDAASQMGRRASYAAHLVDRLVIVERYGRDFLDPMEFSTVRVAAWSQFNEFLGEAVLHRRERAFWQYQSRGLATVGAKIPWLRVIAAAVRQGVALAASPRRVSAALASRVRARRNR